MTDTIDLFLATAADHPDKPAVVRAGRTVTYAEFERMVRGIAAQMAGRGTNVLIALPQGAEAYAAMFGAVLAGCFYTPVNTAVPIDKMRRIARLLQPDMIVAEPALQAALAAEAPAAAGIAFDGGGELLSGRGSRHELSHVIFTSGSTGVPKGAVIRRAALDRFIAWVKDSATILPDDRVSQFPNIAFDMSVTDIYGALCQGATVYPFVGPADRTFPARVIARERLTVWNSTPSVLSLMMRAGEATAEKLGTLRLLNFGGEPLLPAHVAAVHSAAPAAILQNTYGPTETTVSMTALHVTRENAAAVCGTSAAIGAAIPGVGMHLVGGPHADEGEIVITGPQLALGYWNDPERTAASFRVVDVGAGPERAYFTGDWATRRDGHIFFKQRVDHQVKMHGFRLELDEVAQAIHEQGYPVACVLKFQDELAAVIEASARPFDEAALRAALAKKLEKHAVPTVIRLIEKIPRSDNDKLDRAAVAAWLAGG